MSPDQPSLRRSVVLATSRLVGRVGGRLRYNRRRREIVDGNPYHARRRRWYGAALIRLVNLVLSWQHAGIRVLDRETWFARETSLWRKLYSCEVLTEGDTLFTPELPGETLDLSLEKTPSLDAVRAAASGLAALHAAHETHGDATAENVLWDAARSRAYWIDFDTAHRPRFDPIEARGDDIRALSASVMRYFDLSQADEVAEAIVRGYGDAYEIERAALRLRRTRLWIASAPSKLIASPSNLSSRWSNAGRTRKPLEIPTTRKPSARACVVRSSKSG